MDFVFEAKDVRVDEYRHGHQSRLNHGYNAVRITHIETGLYVECFKFRSQCRNRYEAFKKLNILLIESNFVVLSTVYS